MYIYYRTRTFISLVILLFASISLGSCVNAYVSPAPKVDNNMFYTFTFDVHEMPDIEILDFRYGDESKSRTIRNPDYLLKKHQSLQSESVYAQMPKQVNLYAKWRIKSTSEIFEDSVDLTNKLANIKVNYLTFIIKGSQLNVFLVTYEPRPIGIPAIGPRVFESFKSFKIYPN